MDNYKIKVKDEAESKEAQELFFELGYEWRDSKRNITNLDVVFIYAKDGVLTAGFNDHNFAEAGHKELTLPQLRDLVVLKRNDASDANHHAERGGEYFITSDGDIYFWMGKWVKSTLGSAESLTATETSQPQDPALISGADALRALADGKEVDVHESTYKNEVWFNLKDTKFTPAEILAEKVRDKPYTLTFRLKPQTIKLELELPKPFEPEEDCHVYILDDGKTDGYRRYSYEVHGDKGNTFIGIWRTEEEIKQVVEQLRKIRGAS
ncbi:hypothetical protein OKB31_000218 [Acinetobacter baumannii]|uniref:hypothetical protein n=1 Tax=Acinetobacter baumannii TaxID=470 RepID=UPI001127EF43|nr:hypothetical protein [Acinetobacter baumannii]EKW6893520.1 hypothetical protein [Acinetobacter baumannii]TPT63249.1 hypothetical protein FJU62_00885 [Acinetobacter baumannii]